MPSAETPPAAPEELRVASETEVAAFLLELQREQARLTLSSPDGRSLTSRICALNPNADLLGLEVADTNEPEAQAMVAGGEITAVAYLGSIKLQFELDSAVLVSGETGTVMRSALPSRMYRFQRRQAFRVQPAGALFPRVLLPRPAGLADYGLASTRGLRVLDISIGGLALQLPADFSPMAEGESLNGLTLELDRSTPLRIGLRALHLSQPSPNSATRQLGCAFLQLDPSVTRALQVYVDQTQKRRRLLKLIP